MALARNSLSRRLHLLLESQNPLCVYHIIHFGTPYFHHRPIASSAQTQDPTYPESERKENKKPLSALFEGPVGSFKKTENGDSEGKDDPEYKELKRKLRELGGQVRSWKAKLKKEGIVMGLSEKTGYSEDGEQHDPENDELARKLGKLKEELRESEKGVAKRGKLKKAEPMRLHAVFKTTTAKTFKEDKLREPVVLKELSPDMEIFVNHLYKEGYFNDANFVKGKSFDLSWFDNEYARNYILFAVQKFSKDKQEIAKWLSGSDLKQVAMFGCPSVLRAHVFPVKILRKFFEIPENSVCSKCMLRQSCKFVNQSVWGSNTNNLDLATAMKVITSYAMPMHPQLVLPDEIKNSVSRLLKEVLNLSQTI